MLLVLEAARVDRRRAGDSDMVFRNESDEYRQGVLLLKGELKCCGIGDWTTKLLDAVEDSQRPKIHLGLRGDNWRDDRLKTILHRFIS
jgi:hypothetical protein